MSGLWACIVGGVSLAALVVVLNPIRRPEDCPNYGAAGNASAFANEAWDLYLPLLTIGWLALVVVEQVLPVTWRGRRRLDGTVRAAAALVVSATASFCLVLPLVLVCR